MAIIRVFPGDQCDYCEVIINPDMVPYAVARVCSPEDYEIVCGACAAKQVRCADCGLVGETIGHQTCQYPR